MIQYITGGNKTVEFNGETTVSIKILLMFWKLVTEKMMIMLANTNLLIVKSAIPVTLKDRWCYDNVHVAIDNDICAFDFWKIILPI